MMNPTITRLRDASARTPAGVPAADVPGVDLAPLLGGWVNYDTGTTGLLRVELSTGHSGQLRVRAVGAGPPPVEWPEATGAAFAGRVDQTEAVGFAAHCELGFATVLLAAYLNLRLLVVDAYTDFLDSGRSPYFQRDHFYLPAGR